MPLTQAKRPVPKPSGEFQKLEELLGKGLRRNEILAPYTTFKIGGPADYFYPAQTSSELCNAILVAEEVGIDYFLLAGGSNLLINDRGYRGLMPTRTIGDQYFKPVGIIATPSVNEYKISG